SKIVFAEKNMSTEDQDAIVGREQAELKKTPRDNGSGSLEEKPGAKVNIAIDNPTTYNDIPLDGFDYEGEIRRIGAKQQAHCRTDPGEHIYRYREMTSGCWKATNFRRWQPSDQRPNNSSRPSNWLYREFLTLIQYRDGFSVTLYGESLR